MTRILITGGGSYLGQHLVPLARAANDVHYTVFQQDPLQASGAHQLDIREERAVQELVHRLQPEVIIHTIGSNRGRNMEAVIEQGTAHITRAAGTTGSRLIHLSTDVIFDGTEAPYKETAKPSPINAYGRAKALAENLVRVHPNHVIIRTSLIYGLNLMDHGTRWMVEDLRAGRNVTLFSNQIRNPVWVKTLCDACLELANHTHVGVLNVAGEQQMSRAQFALKMLEWWEVSSFKTLSIEDSTGDRFPLDCSLDLSLARSILATPLPGVDEVLERAGATSGNGPG